MDEAFVVEFYQFTPNTSCPMLCPGICEWLLALGLGILVAKNVSQVIV
jgi:hypothetical protein